MKENYDITAKEMSQIAKAMEDKKFRNLLGEYMEEISDPKNRAVTT